MIPREILNRHPRWIATLLIIPLLYAAGWLEAMLMVPIGLPKEQVSLLGTLLSFLQFVWLMPIWARIRWNERHAFRFLGLSRQQNQTTPSIVLLVKGTLLAIGLLGLFAVPLVLNEWALWRPQLSIATTFNALILGLVVGVAEELIFRSWLHSELKLVWRSQQAIVGQALILSVVHTRFNLGASAMMGLLVGLFLLGMLLAIQRKLDQHSLWGCIGLHGGLVAGWFVLQSELLQISTDAPAWLIGPGGAHANPLGSNVAIVALIAIILLKLLRPNTSPASEKTT